MRRSNICGAGLLLAALLVTGEPAAAQTARDQYWHGDSKGVEWHPTGQNLAYVKGDPRINPALTEHSRKMDQGIFKVGDNAYVAYGFALTSPAFIVGPSGVIVIDPPESVSKMNDALAAFRRFSDKPIVAILYSHWHPDHYGGVRALATNEQVASGAIKIIAHKSFMDNVIASSASGDGPIIGVRADYSLGNLLDLGPDGRINGGLGPDFQTKEITLIPPTVLVDGELDMEIAGLKVHFEWAPSEAVDEIVTWFPDLKLLHSAEVIQGESFPNLHTIRGSRYREPERWFRTIDRMRRFPAQFMLPSHGRPVAGSSAVAQEITNYRDAIQYVFDQTLRYMNKGYLPDELAQAVQLPASLASDPFLGDFYGGVKHSVRQIYNGHLGWFQGDPTFLDPLPNIEASRRYVAMMGGRAQVFKAASASTAKGDNQWSAELLTHVIRVDIHDMEARNLKARNLREIGYKLTNTNWRNWLMSSALELEGRLDHSKAVNLQAPDVVAAFPPAKALESLRFRVDGARAAADRVNIALGVTLTDIKRDISLSLRNGVLEVAEGKLARPDVQLVLDTKALGAILAMEPAHGDDPAMPATHPDALLEAIDAGKISLTAGTKADVSRFFSYIDRPSKDVFPVTLK